MLRLLIACTLLAAVAIYALVSALAAMPQIDASWRGDVRGRIQLVRSDDPALHPRVGAVLAAVDGGGATAVRVDALVLQRSPRWVIKDAQRERQAAERVRLERVLASPVVGLTFTDGTRVAVTPRPPGVAGLPLAFWLFATAGLTLYFIGIAVVVRRPSAGNGLYALIALCQTGNLMFIAVEMTLDFGLPSRLAAWEMPVRMGFDLVTAAAMLQVAYLHSRRHIGLRWVAMLGWGVAVVLIAASAGGWLSRAWWWTQGTGAVLGLLSVALLTRSYRLQPHPFAIVLRRFAIVGVATWSLMTLALAAADGTTGEPHNIGDVASLVWYLFLASLLLLLPFLARSNALLREFALLAAIGSVAISLNLVFVSSLPMDSFTALALALFASLGAYAALRHWVMSPSLHASVLTTERMFEQLYRIAREVRARPERTAAMLSLMLSDLFEPLEIDQLTWRAGASRVVGGGSSLLVPVPALAGDAVPHATLRLRFAQRGRRLFTSDDARLTERIAEQLRRAVHYDEAVEQGRGEERMRIAQDLHDDIGARLLTLMYKAQSPEMQDYARHTLQDLKTLTRGLAASTHPLSQAAAEWKSDLTQRLGAAHVGLDWSFSYDDDLSLTVVHWSALTRILRELVSNIIAHARATRVEIDFRLENDRLQLVITDDGVGRDPAQWSQGLGLGGVRKRVRQLGGEVEWREVQPRGIRCRVVIRDVSMR